MNLETIELTKQNKIAVIKLNRPKLLNAVNEQLVWDLQKATEDVKNDDDIRVVILVGSGRGFQQAQTLAKEKLAGKVQKMLLSEATNHFLKILLICQNQ